MTERQTRIGWIRHGITEWNALGKIQGVTDIPLGPEGIRQAERLADRLARDNESWDGVYSSDLKRAAKTGEIIARKLGIPLRLDARLRERSFGQAEGTTHAERLARWGEGWRSLVPDQESDELVIKRGLDFVEELLRLHPGESCLVVTHGSFLTRMIHALCRDLEDVYLVNVSLTVIEKRGADWVPLLHNCTAHLNGDSVEAGRGRQVE